MNKQNSLGYIYDLIFVVYRVKSKKGGEILNKKILFVKEKNKYYSYHEIYSYKNKDILSGLNEAMAYGKNNIYCVCNGKNSKDKWVKMHTRALGNGYYTLIDSKGCETKHKHTCPKADEESVKYMLANKGRIISQDELALNIYKRNKSISKESNYAYPGVFYLGEAILAMANNAYIDKYLNTGTQAQVLSYLYGYYDKGIDRIIDIDVCNLKLTKDIKLKDIIFTPKWIKCDEQIDKTCDVVKNSKEINKRFKIKNTNINQYILAKYMGYTSNEDGTVDVELFLKCKKVKGDNKKKVSLTMNRFDFFNALNRYKLTDTDDVEYFVSALIYEENNRVLVDEIAFIPVYSNYCIPIDNLDQVNILKELIKFRNRISVKRVAKIDRSFNNELEANIPDFIVDIKGSNRTILIESFDYVFTEYFKTTLLKTKKYTELIKKNDKYEFLGIYNNLNWKHPPLSIILDEKYKTMNNLYSKVKFKIEKDKL